MKRVAGVSAVALTVVFTLGGVPGAMAQEAASAVASPQTGIQFPRPIPMGSSCGNWQSSPFIYAGTCGLRVRFFSAPTVLAILSNNHVFGAQGPSLCPNTAVPIQTITLQPGTLDIGSIPGDPVPFAVGRVAGFVPINFASGANNIVDAALSYTTASLSDTTIFNLGVPTQAVTNPAPGMGVTKTGRTTDTTAGTIQSVGTTVLVNYGAGCGIARFVGQIVITPGGFSAGGDSGSAILETSTKIPVGLLFAGSASQTIANDIRLAYLTAGVFPDGAPPVRADGALATPEALVASIQQSRDPELDRVSEIRTRAEEEFFKNPNVTGLGVGLDESGHGLALIVYARKSAATLAQALPASVEGVPVRVVPSGVFNAYHW
jgi:hypothetical protein